MRRTNQWPGVEINKGYLQRWWKWGRSCHIACESEMSWQPALWRRRHTVAVLWISGLKRRAIRPGTLLIWLDMTSHGLKRRPWRYNYWAVTWTNLSMTMSLLTCWLRFSYLGMHMANRKAACVLNMLLCDCCLRAMKGSKRASPTLVVWRNFKDPCGPGINQQGSDRTEQ